MNGHLVTCKDGEIRSWPCQFDACVEDSDGARCEDVPCLPNCFGRSCGDDDCGGSCGDCRRPETCDEYEGVCRPTPICDGREPPRCIGQLLVDCSGDMLKTTWCPDQGMICDIGPCDPVADCHYPRSGTDCPLDLPITGACEKHNLFRCIDDELEVRLCSELEGKRCRRIGMEEFDCVY